MVRCYTLVRVKPPRDKEVYWKIKDLPEAKEVIVTYGEYDLIIEIEVNSLDDLDFFIFNKLRIIEGVEATTTLVEANPPDVKRRG
jgi:DNA-binding Lrp family transcriptional regulator